MKLLIALATLLYHVTADSPQICGLCQCSYVMQTPEDEPTSLRFVEEGPVFDRYLYINCSADTTVGELSSAQWPQDATLGIFANFRKSQWREMKKLPLAVQKNIVKLSISENYIQSANFAFPRMTLLDFSLNHVARINKTTFENLPQLRTLDLSRNQISAIESKSFVNNYNLHMLNLSGNSLQTLRDGMFQGLDNLTTLDLSFNSLTVVQETLGKEVTGLRQMYLAHNKFEILTRPPKSLVILDLSYNQLSHVTFGWGMDDLEVIDLGHNLLTNIEPLFELGSLKTLNAAHNSISVLPDKRSGTLQVLNLADNQIQFIPPVITAEKLPSLQELYLDGNPIGKIHFQTAPEQFSSLRVVSLSRLRGVTEIEEDTFAFLVKSNDLGREPPPLFRCSEGRLQLNLSNNAIQLIQPKAFVLLELCSLDLSGNRLASLDGRSAVWDHIEHLDLQRNPWQCDCDLQWLLDRVMPRLYQQDQALLQHLECTVPARFHDKNFVFWLGKSREVFCRGPSAVYIETGDGTVLEFWTPSIIASIVIAVVNLILLIALIVALWHTRCRARRPPPPPPRWANLKYKEIRGTVPQKPTV